MQRRADAAIGAGAKAAPDGGKASATAKAATAVGEGDRDRKASGRGRWVRRGLSSDESDGGGEGSESDDGREGGDGGDDGEAGGEDDGWGRDYRDSEWLPGADETVIIPRGSKSERRLKHKLGAKDREMFKRLEMGVGRAKHRGTRLAMCVSRPCEVLRPQAWFSVCR
jgi:hypothetical protein